jgi:phenylalanyl-tRNA synthetase beta chain
VAALIRAAAGDQLDDLTLFDRYQGPPLAADEVSLAYRLRFQPIERPLTDDELESMLTAVGRALREAVGARIRGAEQGSEPT